MTRERFLDILYLRMLFTTKRLLAELAEIFLVIYDV